MRVKKALIVIMCLALVFTLASCGGEKAQEPTASGTAYSAMKTELNPQEYIFYLNMFEDNNMQKYEGKAAQKKGIFTKLYDEYNGVERYYVWGYNDNTKCCDWQWEVVPKDKSNLPPVGSHVQVEGTYSISESALDSVWLTDATFSILDEFTGSTGDVDCCTMGGTLERVQVQNMQAFPEKFEGKRVSVYGRIESETTVQHPYYNECFSQPFQSEGKMLAIGTVVIVSGVYKDGIITNATVSITTDY